MFTFHGVSLSENIDDRSVRPPMMTNPSSFGITKVDSPYLLLKVPTIKSFQKNPLLQHAGIIMVNKERKWLSGIDVIAIVVSKS